MIRKKINTKQKFAALTKGETDNPYESVKLLNEYLSFNYGGPAVNCLFDGPSDGFDFPKQTAEICIKYFEANVRSILYCNGMYTGRAS